MPAQGCSCLGCSGYVLEGRQDWGCLGEPPTWGVLASAFPGGCCCRAQDTEREVGLEGCQTLPESGEKQEGAASCLGATGTPDGARRVVAVSSMHTSSWLAQDEGPSGEGRKQASPRCWQEQSPVPGPDSSCFPGTSLAGVLRLGCRRDWPFGV